MATKAWVGWCQNVMVGVQKMANAPSTRWQEVLEAFL